jgi:tetratricopeptide (TPR) repeat protein
MLHALALAGEARISSVEEKRVRAFQFMVSRDYDRAAPLFAELEEQAPASDKAAAALESGWVAQQRDDTGSAIAAYERALKTAPGYAAAKLRLAYLEGRRRQVDGALKTYVEAEALYSAASDYEGVTESLLQRATLLTRSSKPAEAILLIEKALMVARLLNSPSQRIRLELAEGVALRYLGETQQAGALAQHAVDEAEQLKMENAATSGLIDLGNSFLVRGDLEPAEQQYRRALDFARRSHGRRNEARAETSLGSLFEQKRQPAEAQRFLEAALPFYRQAGYRRELVQATVLLGSVHRELADFEEGIRILREALPNAVNLRDKLTEAQLRERLSECLLEQGLWPDALGESERATALLGSGIEGASARIIQAQAYWMLGRRQEAEQALTELEQLLKGRTGQERLEAELQLARSQMAYAEGHLSEAAAVAGRLSLVRGGDTAKAQASLIQALVLVRGGGSKAGGASLAALIDRFEQDHLSLNAASTRLAAAEALLAANDHASASRFAGEALSFFEAHRIWEAVWRAHAIQAKISPDSAQARVYHEAARVALDQLKALWPAPDVDRYLARSDIRFLYSTLRF